MNRLDTANHPGFRAVARARQQIPLSERARLNLQDAVLGKLLRTLPAGRPGRPGENSAS